LKKNKNFQPKLYHLKKYFCQDTKIKKTFSQKFTMLKKISNTQSRLGRAKREKSKRNNEFLQLDKEYNSLLKTFFLLYFLRFFK